MTALLTRVLNRVLTCALLAAPFLAAAQTTSPSAPPPAAPTVAARLPDPAVSLAYVTATGTLYAQTDRGELWTVGAAPARRLSGLATDAPITACGPDVAAVLEGGQLWWGGLTGVRGLSTVAGTLCAPDGALLVVAGSGDLLRVEAGGRVSRRAALKLLPDARPTLADLRGDGRFSVAVLADPGDRLAHGVLGDALEATTLLSVDPVTLRVHSRLTLPAPYVFEDWEARPVRAGTRDLLAVVRSSAQRGAALTLVGLDAARAALRIEAVGPDFGRGGRWLAPFTDGAALYAVHTPHIGGVLHRYERVGSALRATALTTGVSSHQIGARRVTGGVWQGAAWVGTQDGTRTRRVTPAPESPASAPVNASPVNRAVLNAGPSSPLLITPRGAFLGLNDGQVVQLP
ncbi:hypothetical protein GCM10008959_22730 [Deinococcus seoulensis]|uniref:Uncharacterized protein n=1 Tax=Deinococcus seoulensis TaxID=1837379 RepID=A0ABQ2RW33_9DEIO|nr:hypothetical protein [Deinococcus seoulensis]GGR60314.1 hypothetical protein GCM10008959_22730 [Deinococcus seoulensis]